ncbi:beta-galactosidase [Wukongibacter baidiensis]|uniref:beta-galactosidase n=1 Tax=Wukongibacter baidiensis TaxID=1723361 RepID=UPI003D7F6662
MYLGVDYYPEHWDIDMMDEDIRGMKELGVNIVRIGEFAWHLMEKQEGEFDFSFFDMVIDKLKAKDIKVMFGTPTATFPAWLAKKHPSILSKDENLQTRVFGGRRQYCYNSEIYKEYSRKIVTKLVEHYKDEESIISWQIDNEFGHEGSDMCFCENCQTEFQFYISDKYKDIDELNKIYGTIFWGQTYNSFDEIPIPLKTITTHNPALQLDWARFRSHSLNSFTKEQIELVRSLKGEHQTITTNVAGGFFGKWFDHEENVKDLDFVSYDNYPVWGGVREPLPRAEIAMNLDFIRGLQDKNFWIVEQLMGAQGHTVIGYLPRPNQAKMWSYQAFAHGCTNMLYFRWRGMTRGAEQFCFGIIDHDNRYGRKYREVQSFMKEITTHGELFESEIKSDVALLYDYDNSWSWRFQPQSTGFDFTKELMRLYTPFYNLNTHIDVVPVTRDFTKYKVLVIPVLQIIDKELAHRLENFVTNGGTIVFSFRAGIKDKNNNINFGEIIPCSIRKISGIEVSEIESLQIGQEVEIVGKEKYKGKSGLCEVWRDLITPTTAKTLYKYNDKLYNDKACITVNEYGEGRVYYIGGGVDTDIIQDIVEEVVIENKIRHIKSQDGLEVYIRDTDDEEYLVLTNHTDETKKFKDIEIEPYGSRVINCKEDI